MPSLLDIYMKDLLERSKQQADIIPSPASTSLGSPVSPNRKEVRATRTKNLRSSAASLSLVSDNASGVSNKSSNSLYESRSLPPLTMKSGKSKTADDQTKDFILERIRNRRRWESSGGLKASRLSCRWDAQHSTEVDQPPSPYLKRATTPQASSGRRDRPPTQVQRGKSWY